MKKYIIKPIHYAFLGLMALSFSLSSMAWPIKEKDIGSALKSPDGKYYELRGSVENPYMSMLGVVNFAAIYDMGLLNIKVINRGKLLNVEVHDVGPVLQKAFDQDATVIEDKKNKIIKINKTKKIRKITDSSLFNTSHIIEPQYLIPHQVLLYIDGEGRLFTKLIVGVNVKIQIEDEKLFAINPLTNRKVNLKMIGHPHKDSGKTLYKLLENQEEYSKLYKKYIIDPYLATHHEADGHSHGGHDILNPEEPHSSARHVGHRHHSGHSAAHHSAHRHDGDHHHGGGGGGGGGGSGGH